MKKFLAMICALALVISLCACAGNNDTKATEEPKEEATSAPSDATAAPTAEPTEEATAEPTAEPTPDATAVPEGYYADVLDFVFDKDGIVDRSGKNNTIEPCKEPSVVMNETLGQYVLDCAGGSGDQAGYNFINFSDYYEAVKQAFTMEVYCKVDDAYGEMYALSGLDGGGIGLGYDPAVTSEEFCAYFRNGDSYVTPTFGAIETEKWVSLAMTWDGSKITLYRNGVKVSEAEASQLTFTENVECQYLAIGCDAAGGQLGELFWNGQVASGKVYSRALSAAEIEADYLKLPAHEELPENYADVIDFVFDDKGIVDRSGNTYDIQTVNDPYIVKNDKLGTYVLDCAGGNADDGGACYNIFGYADKYYDTLVNGFTVEVYCMINEASQEMYCLSNLHAGGFSIGLDPNFSDYEDSLFTLFRNGSDYDTLVYGTYEEGKWTHLAFTWDGVNLVLYKDGVKTDEAVINDYFFTSVVAAQYLCVGADSSENQQSEYFWDGQIASGKIYSRALTAEEIASDYARVPKAN